MSRGREFFASLRKEEIEVDEETLVNLHKHEILNEDVDRV